MKKHILSTMILTGGMLCTAPTPAHAVEIIDIGPISGTSWATGLNNSGQVTGGMHATGGPVEAFFWGPGTGLQPLGTFGYDMSIPTGINDQGRIVGHTQTSRAIYPYLWDPVEGYQMLGSGTGGATGINNHSWVVGGSSSVPGTAFLWTPEDGMQPLNLSAGGSPQAISDTGYVTGHAAGPDGGTQPFLWKGGVTTYLGYLEGDYTVAKAVNDFGQVVGFGDLSDGHTIQSFIWDAENGMQQLDILNAVEAGAKDINNAGQIVGNAFLPGQEDTTPFFYEDGAALDLNSLLPADSGWRLIDATAINEVGQIVGYGEFSGSTRAFIMTIPAPGTLSLVLFPIVFQHRRRK